MKKTVGITGGIGSGKSIVARVCRSHGFPVYDCDYEAKRLMDDSPEIKRLLRRHIYESCVDSSGAINRAVLSSIVFSDSGKLKMLNEIVHGEVRKDFTNWRERQTASVVFIETAIPTTSNLDILMDRIWIVEASMEVRIKRVVRRSSLRPDDVEKRIKAQDHEFEGLPDSKIRVIDNNGEASLLLCIDKLLNEL